MPTPLPLLSPRLPARDALGGLDDAPHRVDAHRNRPAFAQRPRQAGERAPPAAQAGSSRRSTSTSTRAVSAPMRGWRSKSCAASVSEPDAHHVSSLQNAMYGVRARRAEIARRAHERRAREAPAHHRRGAVVRRVVDDDDRGPFGQPRETRERARELVLATVREHDRGDARLARRHDDARGRYADMVSHWSRRQVSGAWRSTSA